MIALVFLASSAHAETLDVEVQLLGEQGTVSVAIPDAAAGTHHELEIPSSGRSKYLLVTDVRAVEADTWTVEYQLSSFRSRKDGSRAHLATIAQPTMVSPAGQTAAFTAGWSYDLPDTAPPARVDVGYAIRWTVRPPSP